LRLTLDETALLHSGHRHPYGIHTFVRISMHKFDF
jgi:hypothetical protein